MAPDPINTDRVYRGLKAQIVAGKLSLGARIDPQAVAREYGTSVTPVRDAIHRLIGEQKIEVPSYGGFLVPPITDGILLDLYGWNARLALLAAKLSGRTDCDPLAKIVERLPPTCEPTDVAMATASLFTKIADRSGSRAHRAAVDIVTEGLHAARLAEAQIMKDVRSELFRLARMLDSNRTRATTDRIVAYHRKRAERISEIIGKLHSFHVISNLPESRSVQT